MNDSLFGVRNIVRKSVLDILGICAKPSIGVHILNGHMSHRTNPNICYLESLMKQLSEYVIFVNIEEAVDLIVNKKVVDKPLVAFTFDDGFEECENMICPVLEYYGVNGLFFVNPNYVNGNQEYIENFDDKIVLTPGKRPMRWDALRRIAKKGHIIGAHTMDHYMINDNNVEMLEYQIGACKSVIENELGTSCDYFAFPYGRLEHANPVSIDIACGYYKYIFSQSDYKHYFSYSGRVINRRHFEPFWPVNHVKYFLSVKKK